MEGIDCEQSIWVIRGTDTKAFSWGLEAGENSLHTERGYISKSCFLNWILNPINFGFENMRSSAKHREPLFTG